MNSDVDITGISEALQRLGELDKKLERSIVRKGLRAGGTIWRDAARGEAPSRSGKLKRSIKVRAGKRKKGSISINVGMSAKDYTGNAFYGSFIEYGFRIGKRSLGNARKLQPANPFLKRAYDQSKSQASDAVVDTIVELIEDEA